jgi:hypothetical protein
MILDTEKVFFALVFMIFSTFGVDDNIMVLTENLTAEISVQRQFMNY